MGELVNLKRFKKRAERGNAAKEAETNRAKFGRTKSEKARDTHATQKASDKLDSHRVGDENPS